MCCARLGLVLPDYVPLRSVVPIRIVEEFFENRGTGAGVIDQRWMTCPYPMMTKWTYGHWPIHRWMADFSIAEDVLDGATVGDGKGADDAKALEPLAGHPRSAVVVVLPLKRLEPALESPEEKANAITLVYWVLAEWLRAVRVSTGAALPDLAHRRLPLAVGVRHAEEVGDTLRWTGRSVRHRR